MDYSEEDVEASKGAAYTNFGAGDVSRSDEDVGPHQYG
jgi:hypothetical protein